MPTINTIEANYRLDLYDCKLLMTYLASPYGRLFAYEF
jgi:hypothetical protein